MLSICSHTMVFWMGLLIMPTINLTAKEIHIIMQLLRLMVEAELAFEYANKGDIERIRNKLQNVKD